MLSQNFMLRVWVIEHLGPDVDADWNPESLAADTLAALTLEPGQACALSASWRTMPIEEIGELRRYRNLTAHIGRLISYVRAGPTKDQLLAWHAIRERLP
jgi:hypothetical protein